MSSQTMSHCVELMHLVGIRNATAVQTCVTLLAKSGGDREPTLVKICRTQNKVADFLAKLSRMGHLTDLWLQDDPDHIADLSAADCNLANWSIKYRQFAQKSQFSPRLFSKIFELAHSLILNTPTNDTPLGYILGTYDLKWRPSKTGAHPPWSKNQCSRSSHS